MAEHEGRLKVGRAFKAVVRVDMANGARSVADAHNYPPAVDGPANARRLAAAWNAVDGIDTDYLEGMAERTLPALAAENARLRAACEALDKLDCCDGYSFPDSDWPKLWEALNLARAALNEGRDHAR